MRKRIILPTLLLTGALAVGTLGVARAYAQDGVTYPPIVQKIAERFGVSETEVQDVFREVWDEKEANMHAEFAERLDDAVVDGKLTEEQKQKLLAKHEEMQAKMESWRDLTHEERREKMKSVHDEFRKWAEENDIQFPMMVFKFGKPGFGHGFKAGMMFNEKLD